MAGTRELVLYYNPGTPETKKHVTRLKGVLVQMGVRIRSVQPEQVGETVGYLAGIAGFEAQEPAEGKDLPVLEREMLVLKDFSGRRLDELLLNLRRAGVPRIHLKAVLTEHNSKWSFCRLYEELAAEHQTMTEQMRGGRKAGTEAKAEKASDAGAGQGAEQP